MTKINKMRIGLALNAIGLMLDDESYERIKDRLTEIEDIIKDEPDTDADQEKDTIEVKAAGAQFAYNKGFLDCWEAITEGGE